MPNDPTPQDILLKAADIIGEHGWCQGRTVAPDGRVCALGALDLASPTGRFDMEAVRLLTDHIGIIPITLWNDDPYRTAEDVILALKGAAHAE